jgi:hypothetical protein
VIKVDQRRQAKKMTEGGTKVGTPRFRWLKDVENDLRELKIRR